MQSTEGVASYPCVYGALCSHCCQSSSAAAQEASASSRRSNPTLFARPLPTLSASPPLSAAPASSLSSSTLRSRHLGHPTFASPPFQSPPLPLPLLCPPPLPPLLLPLPIVYPLCPYCWKDYPNQQPGSTVTPNDERKWALPVFSMCTTSKAFDVPVPDFTFVEYQASGRADSWDSARRSIRFDHVPHNVPILHLSFHLLPSRSISSLTLPPTQS